MEDEYLLNRRPNYDTAGKYIDEHRLRELRQTHSGELRVEIEPVENEDLDEFHEQQNEYIETLKLLDEGVYAQEEVDCMLPISSENFGSNVLLTCLKLVILILSGSVSVLASFLDSCLDLLSGSIIFLASFFQKVQKHELQIYPVGKRRLETLAVIIFAAIMFTATCQLILKSFESILNMETIDLEIGWTTIGVLVFTVILKLGLYLWCKRVDHPSVKALAQDHRNDVFSNCVALATSIGGYYSRPWLDPLGGIVIGFYILYTWYNTGLENVDAIIGRTASPELLSKLTYVTFHHDERIQYVDTVRAYSVHEKYFVEVDIVVPPEMSTRESHDIGQSLQNKLEKLSEVERAFVHLDYECEHKADEEHQVLH